MPGFGVTAWTASGPGTRSWPRWPWRWRAACAPAEAVRLACAVGATAVTRAGAQDGMPGGADVLAATGVRWPLG